MTTRRRLSPEARREELLDAATRLAIDAGEMSAASLDAVAIAAGCSRNLAYNYFPNHDALVAALAERERHAVAERLLQVPFDDPFDEWFAQVVTAVLDLAEQRGRLLLMLFEQSMFPRATKRREVLVDVIIGKLEQAGLTRKRASLAAPILGSALMGGAGVVVSGRGSRRDVVASLAKVADALLS